MRPIPMIIFLFAMILLTSFNGYGQEKPIDQLRNYIAGGQFVYYTSTSYVLGNNASASSITYVNFCRDGSYNYYSDGSVRAESNNRNYNVQGANNKRSGGTWQVIENQGVYYLNVKEYSGVSNSYPIDVYRLSQGKWKQGNTTYVFAPGKAECH